jgi:hypothetical protein
MAEIYFDIEVGYEDGNIIDKIRNGLRAPSPHPTRCKIITIQYQILDERGLPKGPLRIFKEWESSERDIIRKAYAIINPETKWEFIPVGSNIYFDLGMLKDRAKLYGINYDPWFIYHDLPVIDLKYIQMGMNNFQFKNSGLDKFTGKESSGLMVPVWYHEKQYGKILEYIHKETREFLEFYAKLKKAMPEFRKQCGFY